MEDKGFSFGFYQNRSFRMDYEVKRTVVGGLLIPRKTIRVGVFIL